MGGEPHPFFKGKALGTRFDLLEQGPRGSEGNDDVAIVCARKDRKSRRDPLDRFCDIYCTVILRYSFPLRVWSSCFESYGPKDTR